MCFFISIVPHAKLAKRHAQQLAPTDILETTGFPRSTGYFHLAHESSALRGVACIAFRCSDWGILQDVTAEGDSRCG